MIDDAGAFRVIPFESAAASAAAIVDLRMSPPSRLAGEPVSVREAVPDVVQLVVGGLEVVVAAETGDRIRVSAESSSEAAAAVVEAASARVADPERRRAMGDEPPVVADVDVVGRADELAAAGTADRRQDLLLAVRCTDLTTLEGDDTPGRIRGLCAAALRPDPMNGAVGPVAAVCVYPAMAGLVHRLLAGSGVRTASVAGAFPSGLSDLHVRTADVAAARAAGADEIDIVLDRSAVLSGDLERAQEAVAAAKVAADGAHLKVIIEVGELATAAVIRSATRCAIAGGADTVKTSTGKVKQNASLPATLVIAEALRDHHEHTGVAIGLKVSGGVRTGDEALGHLALVRRVLGDAWLTPERFRFGASSLVGNLVEELRWAPAGDPA